MRKWFLIILIGLSIKGYSQREAFNWMGFGLKSYGYNFNNYPVSRYENPAKFFVKDLFTARVATQSDKYGNLLFYFNGAVIFNKNHEPMDGPQDTVEYNNIPGYRVNPLIIPINDCIYYIFNNGSNLARGSHCMSYHVVDLSANKGLGKVISIFNIPSVPDSPTSSFFSATFHANGKDVWIASSKTDEKTIYTYLVKYGSGIIEGPIKSPVPEYIRDEQPLVISSKGDIAIFKSGPEKFVYLISQKNVISLLKFDKNVGIFKYVFPIVYYTSGNKSSNSGAFYYTNLLSASGKYYYTMEEDNSYKDGLVIVRRRVSLDSTIMKKREIVGKTTTYESALIGLCPTGIIETNQLSQECKAVVEIPCTRYFNYINDPEGSPSLVPKFFVEVTYRNDNTSDGNGVVTPNFISNYFDPDFVNKPLPKVSVSNMNINNTCVNDSVAFTILEPLPGDSLVWEFGDSTKLVTNTNSGLIKHKYTKRGEYLLKVTLYDKCSHVKSNFKIEILPEPVVKATPDTSFQCGSQAINLKVLNPSNDFVYKWSNNFQGSEITVNQPGQTIVTASNRCGEASDTLLVKESKWDIPNVITPNGDGVNDTWNVKSKVSEWPEIKILNRWGGLVYENHQYNNNWNAENVPDGVYLYVLKQNEECKYKGWLEVIR